LKRQLQTNYALKLWERITTCGFCYKDYSGNLEDHTKQEHYQDIGDAGFYGISRGRVTALENKR
jgi:hypothetical protein